MARKRANGKSYPSDDLHPVSFKLEPSVYEHMRELCRMANLRPRQYFSALIEADYDRVQGNPKVNELLKQISELEALVKGMTGSGTSPVIEKFGNK